MSNFEGHEASNAFSEALNCIGRENDRGAVLVSAALLDSKLEGLIKEKLLPSSEKNDPMFSGGNAPLSTFSAKIEFSFRLGLIRNETRKALNDFRRLRNDFAHGYNAVNFDEPQIKNRINSIFKRHKDILSALEDDLKRYYREMHQDGSEDTFFDRHWPIRKTFDLIFAGHVMALERVRLEVEPLIPLESDNDGGE